jgi:DNA-directed RNA polymerase subunit M/transcription elongation factor TFIIS
MMTNVVCPQCGSVLEWNTDDEPLERCEKCGYELSEEIYEGRVWKLNVKVSCPK